MISEVSGLESIYNITCIYMDSVFGRVRSIEVSSLEGVLITEYMDSTHRLSLNEDM